MFTVSQPDQGVFIQSSGFPVAGQPYTLTCCINDSRSSLVWLSSAGEELQSQGRIMVGDIVVDEGVTKRVLTFTVLEVSDSGEYLCRSDTSEASITFQVEGKMKINDIILLTSLFLQSRTFFGT